MTDRSIDLTRRKLLGSVGTVGLAGVGAGLGTSALFSTTDELENNSLTAGTLDLSIGLSLVGRANDLASISVSDPGDDGLGDVDANGQMASVAVSDVKPGDWFVVRYDICVDGNPAFLMLTGDLTGDFENRQTGPGADADSSGGSPGQGPSELDEATVVRVFGPATRGAPSPELTSESALANSSLDELTQGDPSLAEVIPPGGLNTSGDYAPNLDGYVVQDDSGVWCFGTRGGEQCLTYYALLKLPATADNELQSDSVEFGLGARAEQCRNNATPFCDGSGSVTDLSTGTGEWQLTSVPSGSSVGTPTTPEVTATPGNWVSAPAGCGWVSSTSGAGKDSATGEYVFEREFTVPEGCRFDLEFSADNRVEIDLIHENGTVSNLADTTDTNTTFQSLLTVSRRPPAGQYTLRATVHGDGAQKGFLLCGETCGCPSPAVTAVPGT